MSQPKKSVSDWFHLLKDVELPRPRKWRIAFKALEIAKRNQEVDLFQLVQNESS